MGLEGPSCTRPKNINSKQTPQQRPGGGEGRVQEVGGRREGGRLRRARPDSAPRPPPHLPARRTPGRPQAAQRSKTRGSARKKRSTDEERATGGSKSAGGNRGCRWAKRRGKGARCCGGSQGRYCPQNGTRHAPRRRVWVGVLRRSCDVVSAPRGNPLSKDCVVQSNTLEESAWHKSKLHVGGAGERQKEVDTRRPDQTRPDRDQRPEQPQPTSTRACPVNATNTKARRKEDLGRDQNANSRE
jgi:hypothetical protein